MSALRSSLSNGCANASSACPGMRNPLRRLRRPTNTHNLKICSKKRLLREAALNKFTQAASGLVVGNEAAKIFLYSSSHRRPVRYPTHAQVYNLDKVNQPAGYCVYSSAASPPSPNEAAIVHGNEGRSKDKRAALTFCRNQMTVSAFVGLAASSQSHPECP